MNNSITIIGHVGNNPEVINFASGKSLTKFSVAVNESKDETLWFTVLAFNEIAERVMDTITKGREVLIRGRLGLESYKTKTGEPNKALTIKLSGFHLCGKKPEVQSDIAA